MEDIEVNLSVIDKEDMESLLSQVKGEFELVNMGWD